MDFHSFFSKVKRISLPVLIGNWFGRKYSLFLYLHRSLQRIKMLEDIELKPYQVKRLELNLFTFALRRFQLSIKMTKEKRCARAGGGSPGRPPQLHLFTFELFLQDQLTITSGKDIFFTYTGSESRMSSGNPMNISIIFKWIPLLLLFSRIN